MAILKKNRQRTSEAEVNITFFGAFENFFLKIKNLIKQNPIVTTSIISALVLAAIFTGGVALATPATLSMLAGIGAVATFITSGLFSFGKSILNKAIGLGGLIATFGAVVLFPPIGVFLCGVFAVAGGTFLATGISYLLASKSNNTATSTKRYVGQSVEDVGNSYRTATDHLPKMSVSITPVSSVHSHEENIYHTLVKTAEEVADDSETITVNPLAL